MVTTSAPARDSIEAGSALPQPSSTASSSPAISETVSESQGQPKTNTGVIIGIAALLLVLLAAVSAGAWYAYSHRNTLFATRTPNAQQKPLVPLPVQTQGATTTPGQPIKPSAGTPENRGASSPQPQSGSGATQLSRPASTNTLRNSNQQPATAAPPPAIAALPPSPPVPAPVAPRSGTLHYQGPPVPHNGEVVFDHLPHARLKFTFDHQAWNLTIKSNPDGTKKVTLISQAPGDQTSCDLGWEIID
jgi:hypothetical protein